MLILSEPFKPFGPRFTAKPGQLSLRIVPHIEFCLFDSALEIAFAFEVFNDAPVAVRAERIRICGHALREKHFDFLHQARSKVLFRTFIDALVKLGAWRIQNNYAQTLGTLVRLWPPRLLLRHRLSGLQSNFDRALHPRPIARIEFRRTLWIKALQQAMKVFGAAAFPQ